MFASPLPAKDKIFSDAIDIIQSGLSDESQEIRLLSISVLPDLGDEFVPILRKMLEDKSDLVKIEAAHSLFKLGDKAGLPVLRNILATEPKLSDKLKPFERMKAIAMGSARMKAARILGDIKDRESIPVLKKCLDDIDGRVIDACNISLAKLGDPKSKDSFISAIKSTVPQVRAVAAQALGDFGDSRNAGLLRERLKTDWSREVKANSLIALAKLNDRESFLKIIDLLNDRDDIVREKAAVSLGMMGNKAAIPHLLKSLEDQNGAVRIAAGEALYIMGDESGKGYILSVLKGNDKDGKIAALNSLAKMVSIKDIEDIYKLLDDPDKTVAIKAANVIAISRMKEQNNKK